MSNDPTQPPEPAESPQGVPLGSIELDPLEVHMARLHAELQRTQLILALAAAAGVLAALACLYAARSAGQLPGVRP